MRRRNVVTLLSILILVTGTSRGVYGLPMVSKSQESSPQPQAEEMTPLLEVLGVALETEVSGGMFGESARPVDAENTKFVVVTVKFPRGYGYSTKELVLEYETSSGENQKEESVGYAPPNSGWMFVRGDRGMSSLDFYPGGEGTIDMRLLFAVPMDVSEAALLFKGTIVGQPLQVPAK